MTCREKLLRNTLAEIVLCIDNFLFSKKDYLFSIARDLFSIARDLFSKKRYA